MEDTVKIIKYLDLFGTRCTFYSDRMPKLYTVTGGIFSIISILVCILIFVIFSLDDIKRKLPITTTSYIPSKGYKRIKFEEEKIWIPWRISDYNNNEFVNHSGLLYPIIYYYSGIKANNSKDFNLTKKLLNYKLCNETSMVNQTNEYFISIPLNELYCIDMEEVEMGGSWTTEFIHYIEFDLYYCEDGINYNESNSKCTSFNKIKNFLGENNSLEISVYYPIVQFQPSNKIKPIIIIYRQFFYHISKYVNKIDRIFLQENVLSDDSGWLLKKEENYSYWGLNSIGGDTYLIGDEKDLMNEGSSSRAYSFNLYLEPGIIHYTRYYKKLFTIFSDFFPMAYIIFIIMKIISKLFKKTENNKKMIELLFENLKEKPNVFEKNIKRLRLRNYKSINIGKLSFSNYIKKRKEEINISNSNININSTNNNNYYDNTNNNDDNKNNIKKTNVGLELLNKNDKKEGHRSSVVVNNLNLIKNNKLFINSNKSLYNNNRQLGKTFINNISGQNLLSLEHIYYSNNNNNKERPQKNNSKINKTTLPQKIFIKEKLFPYKYYFFSVFIRNLDGSKENCLYSYKFAKVYAFLCQLFDITTYLSLHREFNALKTIFNDKSLHLIEKNCKINVNSNSFIKDINDCIGEQKFYILAQGLNHKHENHF